MLKGLVSLITGGASGLGRATVDRLVRQGGRVVLCDLSTSKGDDIAREIGENKCVFVPADVVEEGDVQNAITLTKEKFGKLDIVVNCAGIGVVERTYDFDNKVPHDLDNFNRILQVNIVGTFNVIRLSVGLIGENFPNADGQRGVIINTASISGYDGTTGIVAYSASKAAVVGITLPLARDLASQGIRVCTIAPGLFETPILRAVSEKVIASMCKSVPHPKRLGNPTEFAHLVQSIIENPMLNGEVIRLDGALRL